MKAWQAIRRFFKSSANYIREVRAELRKVIWPSWADVRILTAAVLFVMIAIGAVLWGTDGILTAVIGLLIRK